METLGFIGLGKIGLPIARSLMASGYPVVGFRRHALQEFVDMGGMAGQSPADVAARAEIVLSCLPSEDALDEVVAGPQGIVHTVRPGQIVVELGSHAVPRKQRHVATLAEKGAIFIDGEVSGTPGMVQRRKGAVYLAGDEAACATLEPVMRGFLDTVLYLGAFGSASRVKLLNNLLVTIHIAATAEAMALGLRAGIESEKLIHAILNGSGFSAQFGARAPRMAAGKFLPAEGDPIGLSHYFGLIRQFAGELGLDTPLLDRATELFQRAIDEGFGEHDNAILVELAAKPFGPGKAGSGQ
jgi:3-hydroxyisobutyrate dehydrogenase